MACEAAYLPASQSKQCGWPEGLYFPAGHGEHSATRPVEKKPELQGVHVVAPVALFAWLPVPHGKQSSGRGTGAYLPAEQAAQAVLLKTYWPASHESQLSRFVAENLPPGHSVQTEDPALVATLPSGHRAH